MSCVCMAMAFGGLVLFDIDKVAERAGIMSFRERRKQKNTNCGEITSVKGGKIRVFRTGGQTKIRL